MTEKEIKEELDYIESRMFLIDMADYWTEEDAKTYERLSKEKAKLEKQLKKIGEKNGLNNRTK